MVDYDKARDCEHGRQIGKCGDCEYQDLLGELSDARDELATVTAQRDELLATMRKLACLGNGDQYGNSEGNTIAQEAIAKCEVQNGK